MKKSLCLTSALVAASVLALGSTAAMAASKGKPMKIGVSGSYKAVVGYARNADGFQVQTGSGTGQTSYNNIDVKTDSVIEMSGSTKTDSGLSIDVAIELKTDQHANQDEHIGASHLSVGGGFGTVTLGGAVAASKEMSVNAPNTGALGATGDDSSLWIVKPVAVSIADGAGADIGGDESAKIRWMSPSFSGFTVGGSYVPSTTSSNAMAATGGTAGTEVQQHDFAVKYSGKMGGNTVNVGANYWSTDAGTSSIDAYHLGLSVTAGAFTIGGSIKDVGSEGSAADKSSISGSANSLDEEAITAGIQWEQGDTTLSLNYFTSEMELSSAVTGEDSVEKWTLGAKYAMGPGVDFLGTVQNVHWKDEGTVATNNNKGTAIVGGIEVAF